VRRLVAIAIIAVALGGAARLHAAITQPDLNEVGVTPKSGAALPLNLSLQAEDGATKPLQFWLGAKSSV
jgi:hypothetical protein